MRFFPCPPPTNTLLNLSPSCHPATPSVKGHWLLKYCLVCCIEGAVASYECGVVALGIYFIYGTYVDARHESSTLFNAPSDLFSCFEKWRCDSARSLSLLARLLISSLRFGLVRPVSDSVFQSWCGPCGTCLPLAQWATGYGLNGDVLKRGAIPTSRFTKATTSHFSPASPVAIPSVPSCSSTSTLMLGR
jgi:hypothetical protein